MSGEGKGSSVSEGVAIKTSLASVVELQIVQVLVK